MAAFSLLLSTLSLFCVSLGQIGCNNYDESIASGQCNRYGIGNVESAVYLCQDQNGTQVMNIYQYNNSECAGAAASTAMLSTASVSSYECVATQESCDFAFITSYGSDDDSCTTDATTHATYLMNVCVDSPFNSGTSMFTCDETSITELEYRSDDCSGSSEEFVYTAFASNLLAGGDYKLYCSLTDTTSDCNESNISLGVALNVDNHVKFVFIGLLAFLLCTL